MGLKKLSFPPVFGLKSPVEE